MDAHIIIKLKGQMERQVLFHRLLRSIDSDWPYGDYQEGFAKGKSYKECEVCGGMVYHAPRFTPGELKAAGKQCRVRVKIRQYCTPETCAKKGIGERIGRMLGLDGGTEKM